MVRPIKLSVSVSVNYLGAYADFDIILVSNSPTESDEEEVESVKAK